MRNVFLLAILVMLTACGSEGPSGGSGSNSPSVANKGPSAPTPTPSPSPTVTPPNGPTCKNLNSVWSTQNTPNNALMGVYLGPPTNGPEYDLDLSTLHNGSITFTYDANHTCTYDVTVTGSYYRLNSFEGCNPGWVLPGHDVNTQCDYCPYAYQTNVVFNYVLGCNTITIQDVVAGQTISYY